MKRLLVLMLLLPLSGMQTSDDSVPVVPLPKQVERTRAEFHLDAPNVSIRSFGEATSERLTTIASLQDVMLETYGRMLARSENESTPVIEIGLPNEDDAFRETVSSAGIWPDERIGDEGYTLSIGRDRILLAAQTETGLFYGVQTLRQLVRAAGPGGPLPGLRIADWPDLRFRGMMDDISRGPVPTMAFMKGQVRRIAEMKMNRLMYYVEHVVRTRSHPEFAPPDGSLSIEDWKELADYARDYHVTLVGNFQSFGHFEKILANPKYSHLGESGRLLSPVLPESIDFLRDIFSEMVPAFHANIFSVNSDETFDLGRGASKQRVDSLGLGTVYAEHILNMHAILDSLGVRTLMWGDVALQHREIIETLPKDIMVGTWDYTPRDSYRYLIDPFKEAGFDFIVCPGVLNSSRVMPDFRQAKPNIAQWAVDALDSGSEGLLITVWDDGGSALFSRDWYGVAYAGDRSWHVRPNDDGFDRRFSLGVYGDPTSGLPDAVNILDMLADLEPTDGMNEKIVWEKVVPDVGEHLSLSLTDWDRVVALADSALGELSASRTSARSGDLDYYRFTSRLYKHMRAVREGMLDAAGAYGRAAVGQTADRVSARSHLVEAIVQIDRLRSSTLAVESTFRKLWLRENRTYSLDNILDRFDRQRMDFEDIADRLFGALRDFDMGQVIPPPNAVRLDVREVSGRYFREWLVAGPLPNPNGAYGSAIDYLEPVGGELHIHPGVADQWEYDGKTYRWTRLASPEIDAVDLASFYPDQDRYVALYAFATIQSPRDMRVRATIGSNDSIRIILNGEEVFANSVKRNLTPDEDEAWLNLKEGRNDLLLKISQGSGGWGFTFRLPDVTVRSRKNRYRIVE